MKKCRNALEKKRSLGRAREAKNRPISVGACSRSSKKSVRKIKKQRRQKNCPKRNTVEELDEIKAARKMQVNKNCWQTSKCEKEKPKRILKQERTMRSMGILPAAHKKQRAKRQ